MVGDRPPDDAPRLPVEHRRTANLDESADRSPNTLLSKQMFSRYVTKKPR